MRSSVIHALSLALLCAACTKSPRMAEEMPLGHWSGSATFRGAALPFSITVFRSRDSLHATFSSPSLMILDQPLRGVVSEPPRLRFHAEELGEAIRFDGMVRGDTLRGLMHFQEPGGGEALEASFALTRMAAPPRPYRKEDVVFPNAGAELAGTLFIPLGSKPYPAVVLLQGSSLNLRHSYAFYADHFARVGVAALIYDKRGTGASTGDYRRAALDELVGDASAAVRFLAERADVVASRIGVWGLSQGAMLAPLVAREADVAFIIAISGPGIPFGETAAYQDSIRVVRRGFTGREAADAATMHRRLTSWMRAREDERNLQALLQRTANAPWRRHTGIPRQLPSQDDREGWYWATRPLDPIAWWKTARIPALIIFGEEDELLPARQSAERIEAALREADNRDTRVVVFPDGDHMLKYRPAPAHRDSGQAWAWPRSVPGYMDTVTAWLLEQTR